MIKVARKTMALIEDRFLQDQGAAFRGHLGELIPLASDAFSTDETPFRKHLGASIIGKKCTREIYLSFRWAKNKKFNGRILRLFNRGHLEEPRFVAMLLIAGCEVWQTDEKGKQWRITDESGHFGGSLDGVARGIPEMPEVPVLTEFKTHSLKSFEKLVKEGVILSKFEHFIQMQIYMHKKNLSHALYMAVNKNTDEIYAEIVEYQKDVAERYSKRAIHIIKAEMAPEKISQDPKHFECKICDMWSICHGKDVPAMNCRTCIYSKPLDIGGQWRCEKYGKILSFEDQLAGCSSYVLNPQIKESL